jgi:hypothetical protein
MECVHVRIMPVVVVAMFAVISAAVIIRRPVPAGPLVVSNPAAPGQGKKQNHYSGGKKSQNALHI